DEALDHESPLEELFEDQLACADMILLNKADLLDGEAMAAIEEDLKGEVRAGVHFVRASHGDVAPSVLLGIGAEAQGDMENRKSHHELYHDGEEHDHDDFDSFIVKFGEVADKDVLVEQLAATIAAHDILRVKGFIDIKGAAARFVVQAVGPRVSGYFDRPWAPGEQRASELVVISQSGYDEEKIRAQLTA
ncbi:MAG: GTP-binding protein, partial [Hyphomicrobiales bacterium]